ncbi:hypothetical protein PsYK624_093350 [Phanerochaete sordida]|uniref:Proteophosphoglycan ppg4 n=1 Tax=Phanerochaete sordida TaxID=48140 RepID=A0A9P3LF40_9APHY|nr:hypothetical protein PsYK624_093350 [Phanerochaete sordida]
MPFSRRAPPGSHPPFRTRDTAGTRCWTPDGSEDERNFSWSEACEAPLSITSHVGSPVDACPRRRRKPSVLHSPDDASIRASTQQRSPAQIRLPSLPPLASAAFVLLNLPALVQAAPLQKRGGGDAVKIIVPVVIVVVVIGLVLMMFCMRRGWHMNMARWTSHAANSFGPSTAAEDGPRELTAQQLVGSDTDVTTDGAAPVRTRRSRRANRRASQISTHSLPVYMKEPGEREVVIFRGPEDLLEEPPTTAHVVMPSVAESAESPDPSVMSRVQSREYADIPESPHDMPLLSDGEGEGELRADMGADLDNSRARLIEGMTPRLEGSRPSIDTLPTTEENASSRLNPQTPDPRGDAPPYFEVVALEDMSPSVSPEIPRHVPTPPPEPDSHRRRSGFFSLFHSRHPSRATAAPANTLPDGEQPTMHRRDHSGSSNISTPTIPRPRSRAQSRAGVHRPSVSGSGFSMMSRSRSRLLDSPHLTSPSMISVNSISAPLTHTTVRTEFTYPRSGPTPEQLKLIASRDSFARFGVPYGHDALAYHASNSRMDLPLHPPPDFEDVAGPSRSPAPDGADIAEVDTPAASVHAGDDTPAHDAEPPAHPTGSPLARAQVNAAEAPAPVPAPAPAAPGAVHNGHPKDSSESTVSAPLSPPPGLGSSASASAPATAAAPKTKPAPIRAPSRQSSTTSFRTADESLASASQPATPFASASSKTSMARLQTAPAPDSPATSSVATPATASPPATPRLAPAHEHHEDSEGPENSENAENTENTDTTPSTPTAHADVGQAL